MSQQSSQYRGVRSERNKWRADIRVNGRKKFLGYFTSELAAAEAYNRALQTYGLTKRKSNSVVFPSNTATPTSSSDDTDSNDETPPALSLAEAVKRVIKIYEFQKSPFSAFNVTNLVRRLANTGDFLIESVPFYFNKREGKWLQKIEHKEVKRLVELSFMNGNFNASVSQYKDAEHTFRLYTFV